MIRRIMKFDSRDRKLLIFLFKNMIKQTLVMNFSEAKEAYFWIKIHLSYDSKKV